MTPSCVPSADRGISAAALFAVGFLFVSSGCGTPPCRPVGGGEAATCPNGSYCGTRGACIPEAALVQSRPARFLSAVDWAETRADRPSEVIESNEWLSVGGVSDRGVFLEFPLSELHFEGEIVESLLLLSPSPEGAPTDGDAEVTVAAAASFHGGRVTHQSRPALRTPSSIHRLWAGAPRLIRIDVTDIVRRAQRVRSPTVALGLSSDGSTLSFVGPHGEPNQKRPRLQVTTR